MRNKQLPLYATIINYKRIDMYRTMLDLRTHRFNRVMDALISVVRFNQRTIHILVCQVVLRGAFASCAIFLMPMRCPGSALS